MLWSTSSANVSDLKFHLIFVLMFVGCVHQLVDVVQVVQISRFSVGPDQLDHGLSCQHTHAGAWAIEKYLALSLYFFCSVDNSRENKAKAFWGLLALRQYDNSWNHYHAPGQHTTMFQAASSVDLLVHWQAQCNSIFCKLDLYFSIVSISELEWSMCESW